jgi:hypothetical protein
MAGGHATRNLLSLEISDDIGARVCGSTAAE